MNDLAVSSDFASDGADGSVALPTGVSQGACHGCAWHLGQAFCWGANNHGALGDGTTTSRAVAMPVVGLSNVVQMAVGCGNPTVGGHSCALTIDGQVWCWGSNAAGQLGDQSGMDQLTPVKVTTLPTVVEIALGAFQSCARAQDGRVFCWGRNDVSQLGDGTLMNRPAPVQTGSLSDAVEIAQGAFHGCARRASGALVCWGLNNEGEIGDGTTTRAPVPTAVMNIGDAVQIVCGTATTCARRADGSAWCWGDGQGGGLGNGTTPTQQTTPVQVSLSFSPVELGRTLAQCARDASGSVSCWGPRVDTSGNTVIVSTPQPMVPLADATSLGGNCATRASGGVACWSVNGYGQVGDGTMTGRASPTSVQGLTW